MESSSLLEVAIRLLLGYSIYTGLSPPLSAPTSSDKKIKGTVFEKYPRLNGAMWIGSMNLIMIIESFVIYARDTPALKTLHFALCPIGPSGYRTDLINNRLILGAGLILAGTTIRLLCYRALGYFFTYEMVIRPNHKLIDFGPYAFVRHPGYVGSTLIGTGGVIICTGPQSYVSMCGWAVSKGLWFGTRGWLVFLFWSLCHLLSRGAREDEALQKKFGKEWDAYAARVPYRYIPGVF